MLVFAPLGERSLARIGALSVGLMSASQGAYSQQQLLLDISQGARIADTAYPRSQAPRLTLRSEGSGASIGGWSQALSRAAGAPALLTPGLLAGHLRGGAGYAGISGQSPTDAIAAADRHGRVAAISIGTAASLPARALELGDRHELVVADLAADGAVAERQLEALLQERPANQLLLVVQRSPAARRSGRLLWSAAADLGAGGRGDLTSASTSERGLIASVDVTATILARLGVAAPARMRGRVIEASGTLDGAGLRSLAARLRVIGPRRLPALGWLLAGWALLALTAQAARGSGGRAWAIRAGALGILWSPLVSLVCAAIEPSAAIEYAMLTLGCLALGAVNDRLLGWPRGPLMPALVVPLALTVDALARGQLLMRSLLGPDPILGARFYGFGNELKAALAVLVLAGVAALLSAGGSRRHAAPVMAGAGLLLALIEGWTRIGAAVGGVVLVAVGFAFAWTLLLDSPRRRRQALIVIASPLLALVLLAVLDLLSAGGSGHYSGSVLHAHSAGELRDLIVRRYQAAWAELRNHAMPYATALCVLLAGWGLARRRALLEPVDGAPVWQAALIGGLACALTGALVEDSGPVLFVVGVFVLTCVVAYLWATPELVTVSQCSQGRDSRCAHLRSRVPSAR